MSDHHRGAGADLATLVIENCAIATVDPAGTEYRNGHIRIDGARISAVGPGPTRTGPRARRIDGRGCLATPGLINTHHHLHEWIMRGRASDRTMVDRLRTLYPAWSRLDAQAAYDAVAAGLAWLALSGCTTTADHQYVFAGHGGDLLAAEIEAASRIGLRFHPCRGSMDRGSPAGGLPPDDAGESLDAILDATVDAIASYHDPSPGPMLRIAGA